MKSLTKLAAMATVLVPLALAIAGSAPSTNPLLEALRTTASGTAEQRIALRRAWLAQVHPQWRTLSASARLQRLATLGRRLVEAAATASDADAAAAAAFQGNLTLVQGPSGGAIALQRQPDCSLSYDTGTYTLSFTAPTIAVASTTTHYQDVLHAAAGLGTPADVFAHGCAAPASGLGSRRGYYLGTTSQGLYMSAAVGYDALAGGDALYYGTVDVASQTVHSFRTDLSIASSAGMTAGDLDGDGLLDVVELDGSSGAVTVWLARADGSLGAPTRYVATGARATAAVMTDVNGDGKLDLVVSGATTDASTGKDAESVAVLLGNGDGTLQAARTLAVSSPTSTTASTTLATLVAVDLRGTGKPDIVGSNGLVLLSDGSGNLTQAPTWAFPPPLAANTAGPFLATGDFDEDGHADVVVSTGSTLTIWRGRGDGTFTAGPTYASDDSVGYVTATDLDGDGHLDLWVGLANGGLFGGDQFGVRQGYALMGRGDGSFSGAPVLPFVYTGHNLVDLDGDGILDGVGVNADLSFTSEIGGGHGGFTAHATLPVGTITLGGTAFSLNGIDSFDLADVNGDGKPDLVFLGTNFVARNSAAAFLTPGFLVALGDGHGGFAAPAFVPAPSFVATGDIDVNLALTNVRLADVDGDGHADLVYNYDDTSFQTHQRSVGIAVQLGNGDGTFQAPHTLVFRTGLDDGSFGHDTAQVQQFADVNRDGRLDLVLVAQTTALDPTVGGYAADIQVALGNGDGTFAAPVTAPGPEVLPTSFSEPTPVVIADMNGDGIPDLVTLGGSAGYDVQVAIALGNGDGTFKTPSRTTFAIQYLGGDQQIAVADFNADGKPDVVVTNPFGAAGIAFGAGDGTLAPVGAAGAAGFNLAIRLPVGGSAHVADFNQDGKPDILAGNVLLMSTGTASATAGDFGLGADSTAGTLHAGASVQSHLTLTPGSGFDATVAFSCAGLPAGAACAFAPASLALSGTAVSTTLTITTTAAASADGFGRGEMLPPAGLALAGLGLVALLRRRPALPWRRLAVLALTLAGATLADGCSDEDRPPAGAASPGATATPAGTYTVVVTAAGGGVTQALSYTLVVD